MTGTEARTRGAAASRAWARAALSGGCGLLLGAAQTWAGVAPFGVAGFVGAMSAGEDVLPLLVGSCAGMCLAGRYFQPLALAALWALRGRVRSGALAVLSGVLCALTCLGGWGALDIAAAVLSGALCVLLCPAMAGAWRGVREKASPRGAGADGVLLGAGLLLGLAGLSAALPWADRFSLGTALALAAVCAAGRCAGVGTGAALGAAAGALIGLADGRAGVLAGWLALSGALSGLFAALGRWGAAGAALVGLAAAGVQAGLAPAALPWRELAAGGVLIAALPDRLYHAAAERLRGREQAPEDDELSRLRRSALLRLTRLLPAVEAVAASHEARSHPPLCSEVAAGVCRGCVGARGCWRERTGSAHAREGLRLVGGAQGTTEMLTKNCLRADDMEKQLLQTAARRESAGLMSRQLRAVGELIGGVARSLHADFSADRALAARIRAELARLTPDVTGVSVVREGDRLCVELEAISCVRTRRCEGMYADVISRCAGQAMQPTNYGCVCKGGRCRLSYQMAERLELMVGVSRRPMGGERQSGDAYSFGRLEGGRFYVLLSDGMGSGREAGRLSARAASLVEDYLSVGLTPAMAVETANRSLGAALEGCERFATLDLHCISLFTGEIEYVKVGACHSYILSPGGVRVLADTNLPLGMFDELPIRARAEHIAPGESLVVISDGICDPAARDADAWLRAIAPGVSLHNPQAAAEYILSRAPDGERDDRTAIVVRVI